MVKPLKEKTNLTRISSVLSLFTLVAFHWPFFRLVLGNIEGGFNGVLITGGLGVLMFALNFLVYYLVLFLGRFVGKCILAFTFIGNAISLYFINTYQVLITDKMMGNVFNTRYSEASGFFSWSAVWYLLFLGVVPCIYIFARRFDYGSWKRFFARTGIALAVSLAIALINMQNWPWIDRNAPKLGSLVMPWSYTVNSVRYYNSVKKQKPERDSPARREDRFRQQGCMRADNRRIRQKGEFLFIRIRQADQSASGERQCDRTDCRCSCDLYHGRREGHSRP